MIHLVFFTMKVSHQAEILFVENDYFLEKKNLHVEKMKEALCEQLN